MNKHKQHGFVSIFSVLIIMAILTLIVVGFSSVTRRAQSQTLNSQLNTQAFYAAESGVNDAIRFLLDPSGGPKNQCQGTTGSAFFTGYNNGLAPDLNVGYTCVLISTTNPSQVFGNVPVEADGTSSPVVAPLHSSGTGLRSFDVVWGPASGTSTIPSDPTFPLTPAAAWTGALNLGMVRMDLVPTDTSFDRASLTTNSYTFFLYPSSAAPSSSYTVLNGTANQGRVLRIQCGSVPCTAHITLGDDTVTNYTMRLTSIYSPTHVTITNGVDRNNAPINWEDGQALIDVTGKANDVFRRIQVYKALTQQNPTASFGVQSGDSICKTMLTMTGQTIDDASVDTFGDPACAIP